MPQITDRLNLALAGRYRIERHLGEGGMATVYLCDDLRHERKVALKLLKPELAAVLGAERFVQEIKTTAALQHPHILPLFDSGAVDGFLFYVMPFIQGETLRAKLDRETQLGVDDAVRIAREVLDALHYAHEHGIVHRDVKPENILLHGGHAMVADFGIALAVSAAAGGRMTETGLSLGTPHYMSPEQATAEKEITARSDVYSVGAVLYEMLTGNPPHTGASAQQIIMKIITTPADMVTVHRKSVPPNVAAAVAKSLEKVPADRFESAKTFADALGNSAFTVARADAPALLGKRRPLNLLRDGLLVLAGAAIAFIAFSSSRTVRNTDIADAPVTRFRLAAPVAQHLIPAGDLYVRRFAVSPDGRRIVYRGPGEQSETTRLWVRSLDALDAVPIAGTEGGANPAISPDGKRVAFTTNVNVARPAIRVLDIEGGTPRTVTDSGVAFRGLSWGSDNHLYFTAASIGAAISRVSVDGGAVTPATKMGPKETFHVLPEVLPNGKGVIFTVVHQGENTASWDIVAGPIGPGPHHVVVRGVAARYAASGHLLYVTSEGVLMSAPFDLDKLAITGAATTVATGMSGLGAEAEISSNGVLAYATGGGGGETRELFVITRAGVATPVDTSWRGVFSGSLRVSPDGKWVATYRSDGREMARIWLKSLTGGGQRNIGEPGLWNPSWSPDGNRIVAGSAVDPQLVILDAEGNRPARVISSARNIRARNPSFTGDGKSIVFDVVTNIFALSLEGDSTPRALLPPSITGYYPAISPDGRWLAYVTGDGSRWQVVVRSFENPAANAWTLYTASVPVIHPRWVKDGRELLFLESPGTLMSVPILAGTTLSWGTPRTVLTAAQLGMAGTTASPGFDVLPDGRFIISRPVKNANVSTEEMVVVQNAFALFRGTSAAARGAK